MSRHGRLRARAHRIVIAARPRHARARAPASSPLVEVLVMIVEHTRSAERLARLLVCVSACALATACSPRSTENPRGAPAAPDTAGLLVSTATVRGQLQLPAQL